MKRVMPNAGLNGPQHYWKMMIALSSKGGFTIGDVHKLSNGRSLRTVKAYILYCAKAGHVLVAGERPTVKNRTATIYTVKDRRAQAPVERRASFEGSAGRRRQQLWTAMRALKLFSIRELAVAATTSEIAVTEGMARNYVGVLAKAGYVAEVGYRTRSAQPARWKLLPAASTGPLAPATLEGNSVLYDRNLGRTVNLNQPEPAGRAA